MKRTLTQTLPGTDKRFRDDQVTLGHFADEFLVVCPRCGACATVRPRPGVGETPFAPRRLLCPACALSQDMTVRGYTTWLDRDWYFGCALWLTIRCAGGTLYAFNWRHLTWLEHYVRATLRERRPHPQWGWSSHSLSSCLPAWIKSAKNRRDVLHAIEKLKREAAHR